SARRTFSNAKFCLLRGLSANSGNLRSAGARRFVERLNSRGWYFSSARNAETVKNYARRVGTIQRVEVNTRNIVIQQVMTLFQSEVDTHAPDAFGIAFASLQSAQKPGRKPRPTCKLRDPLQSIN